MYEAPPLPSSPKKGTDTRPGRCGICARVVGWRASRLQAATPEQMLERLLPAGTPAAPGAAAKALKAARDTGLPAEVVWRRVWAASGQGLADVAELAANATDDGGALLAELAVALGGSTAPAARALHAAALAAPGALARCGAPEATQAGPVAERLQLLHLLDLCDTYMELHGEGADVGALRAFAAAGVATAAHAFAAAGDAGHVAALLRRHPRGVGRAALSALASLPAATAAAEYLPVLDQLLALAGNPTLSAAELREPDVVESPDFLTPEVAAAAAGVGGPERALAPDAATPSGLATADEIDAWVLERAATIDDESGLANVSLALLKAWAARSRAAVAPAAAALHMWLSVLRRSASLSADVRAAFADMGARPFLEMTAPAQLCAVLVATLPMGLPVTEASELITEVRACALCPRFASARCLQIVHVNDCSARPYLHTCIEHARAVMTARPRVFAGWQCGHGKLSFKNAH